MAAKTKTCRLQCISVFLTKPGNYHVLLMKFFNILLSKDLYIGFLKAHTLTGLSLKEP